MCVCVCVCVSVCVYVCECECVSVYAVYTCIVYVHLCVPLVWFTYLYNFEWSGGCGVVCKQVKLDHIYLSILFCLFFQEVSLDVDPAYMDQFSGLNHVLEALRNKDVEPALEWAHRRVVVCAVEPLYSRHPWDSLKCTD